MAYDLGVLIVHGMGSQGSDFADGMIEELDQRIADLGIDQNRVRWKPVHWAYVVQPKEDQLWRDLSRNNKLDYVGIRKFVISAFGDAIAYQRVPGNRKDVYNEIHKKVHEHVVKLREELGDADKPLIVMAHSLGSVIMSNYIWDEQKGKGFGGTAFEKMETLVSIITFGCNIALFSLAYDPVVSIEFPLPTLPENLRNVAKWLNFFDPDDVLGYPLKPLSPTYDKIVTMDIEINVGGILSSWTPLSHTAYWTDNSFTKPAAELIADILKTI